MSSSSRWIASAAAPLPVRCWPTPSADLNAKAAAKELLIHVNTAHHRAIRIAEKTGRDLQVRLDVIDLLITIRLTDGSSR